MNAVLQERYRPNRKTRNILDSAMGHIQSVEYRIGLRWVFYRLLQDDILTSKEDYAPLKGYASTARKRFWNGWQPDTLVDEGRRILESEEPFDRADVLSTLHLYAGLVPGLFDDQDATPFLIFEAATMEGQFEFFAPWADRCAFRGDASIPHKWNIAQRCNRLSRIHGKPVHILYFGDLDKKGLTIPKSAMADIEAWTDVEVRFTRCGISPGDAERFNIPEKSLKPGSYEWESLSHDDAGTLINESLESVVEIETIQTKLTVAENETAELQNEIRAKLEELHG